MGTRLALTWWLKHFNSLLVVEWCAVVSFCVDPRRHMSCCHTSDSNWLPQSVVMDDGTLKQAIHLARNARIMMMP